ncbi:MAG: DNA-directed RNA polymerase subunit omega [bacterium]|nr:DNA-directed RNA polymerase subunit omega [bacterium]
MSENLLSSLSDENNSEMGQQGDAAGSVEAKSSTLRRDFLAEDFRDRAPNIYEAIIVISKRARQIGQKQAKLIEQYMSSKVQSSDSDEVDGEEEDVPRKPIYDDDDEDAPKFPRFEKPTVLAMNELYKGMLKYEKKAPPR